MRILLVEDDEALCAAVAPLLEREGYRVDVCRDGDDALYYMRQRMFGLCILDRMLPDGMDFRCCAQRGRGPGHAGADDDGAGPCGRPSGRSGRGRRRLSGKAFRRTRAAGPGTRTGPPPRSCGGLRPSLLRGSYSGHGHTGADRRQRAMHALEKRGGAAGRTDGKTAGQTLSRSFLFGRVWGPGADVEEASLDSYVHFIRRRLRAVSSRVTVDTVRGRGLSAAGWRNGA